MRDDPFPFILILVLVISAVVILLWSLNLRFRRRELQHRERLAAFEKGVPLTFPETSEARQWSPRTYLLRGLIWLFSGATIGIFLLGLAQATRQPQSLESRLRNIRFLTDQGASQAQINQYIAERRDDGIPSAMALIGLIPMGVGAAYLILYRAEMRSVASQPPG